MDSEGAASKARHFWLCYQWLAARVCSPLMGSAKMPYSRAAADDPPSEQAMIAAAC